jgi:hypothetical protein
MERDVELAVQHAADLARTRGGSLASITLRGSGPVSAMTAAAYRAFERVGVVCPEVRFELDGGPVRLGLVEFLP